MAPGRRTRTCSAAPWLVALLALLTPTVAACGGAPTTAGATTPPHGVGPPERGATLESGSSTEGRPATTDASATRRDAMRPAEVVSVTASAATAHATDERGEVVVVLQIAASFHVMSNRPSRPNYVATEVSVDAAPGRDVSFGEPVYPEATTLALDGESISIFDGRVVVRIPYETTSSASAPREIRGKVRYQACARGRCLLPKTVPFAVSLPCGSPHTDPSLR